MQDPRLCTRGRFSRFMFDAKAQRIWEPSVHIYCTNILAIFQSHQKNQHNIIWKLIFLSCWKILAQYCCNIAMTESLTHYPYSTQYWSNIVPILLCHIPHIRQYFLNRYMDAIWEQCCCNPWFPFHHCFFKMMSQAFCHSNIARILSQYFSTRKEYYF